VVTLSTNAGGTALLRYGNTRRICTRGSRWFLQMDAYINDRSRAAQKQYRFDNQRTSYWGPKYTRHHHRGVIQLFPKPTARATALCLCRPDPALTL